jgi:hypothetical protein
MLGCQPPEQSRGAQQLDHAVKAEGREQHATGSDAGADRQDGLSSHPGRAHDLEPNARPQRDRPNPRQLVFHYRCVPSGFGCCISSRASELHQSWFDNAESMMMIVGEGGSLKLPGWVRRPPELTPPLQLGNVAKAAGPDLATLEEPANDVAYKMIGGAYGVLGAEVLGQFVPRVVDPKRWGVYVREAGVAWLCRELGPHLDASIPGLPIRMARCVAAHHYVHCAIEAAVTQAHGEAEYLDLILKQSPRHGDLEEHLAEQRFRLQALSGVDRGVSQGFDGRLADLMARTPEGRETASLADAALLVELVNDKYSLGMTAADSDFNGAGQAVPCFLVIEPHLPEPLASSIRQALLA